MKTEQQIKNALELCGKAQEQDNSKMCPIWPKDEVLYCHDCTCRSALKWVLEIKEE